LHTHPEAWPNRVIVNRSTASASEASARLIAREEIEGPQKTDLNALLRGENGVQWQVSSGILWKLNFNHRDYRQLIVLQFDKANTAPPGSFEFFSTQIIPNGIGSKS